MVDLYVFGKHVKSLQLTNSPQSWQAILEWLWDYGNKRHIEKAEYEGGSPLGSCIFSIANARIARHLESISRAKRKSKRSRTEKPLLHHVLRTAGFKAQGESKTERKEVEHKPKAADGPVDSADNEVRRRALHPASPNKRMGKSRLTTCITADEVDADVTPKGMT